MKAPQVQNVSLFEFIIAVIVVLLLILSISKMNLDKKSVIDEVNFEMAKQNFSQNTALIRAQWLIEGRPKTLKFDFYVNEKTISNSGYFELSKGGWPLINIKETNACQLVWFGVNNLQKTDNIEQFLRVKKIEKNNDIECQFCDAGNSESCIVYSSIYGINTTSHTLVN